MKVKFGKKTRILMACFILAQVMLLGSLASAVYAFGNPDFGFTISPTCDVSASNCLISEPTQVGLTATYTVKFIPFNGFMGTVSENVRGAPIGSFLMGTFFLSQPVTDTLIVGNLSLGTTYQLTVIAFADGISHSQNTILTTPKASSSNSNGMIGSNSGLSPDFEMDITLAKQVSSQTSATYYITYTSINGLTGAIDEKVTNISPEFVSFFSSQYNPYSAPSAGPILGPTPSPSFGRCYVQSVGLYQYTCTDVLTIYYNIGSGAKSLTSGIYTIVVTATAGGGFPTHSVLVVLRV